ncbi:MAG: DUF2520 domain-containing protein [Acidimicrobiia bacterium]|nr:DUF2520 domain-containing protein [Acidimicrobiia bacterium]
MDLTVIGPGRAGMSIAIAAQRSGHSIVAVVGRTLGAAESAAARVDAQPFGFEAEFPSGELMLISSRDDVIADLATSIAARIPPAAGSGAVHLSGLVPRSALAPLREAGYRTGTFHPLQTLPNPDSGAAQLAGAWVGITADDLAPTLNEFAESLGLTPFSIADDKKSLYHAAAAAAANFPLGSLAMSYDLFADAGVPFEAARPLVAAIVTNAFELGPRAALTGPVARGDVETVRKQLDAVAADEPGWVSDFAAAVRVLARLSGNLPLFDELLDGWKRPEASK